MTVRYLAALLADNEAYLTVKSGKCKGQSNQLLFVSSFSINSFNWYESGDLLPSFLRMFEHPICGFDRVDKHRCKPDSYHYR